MRDKEPTFGIRLPDARAKIRLIVPATKLFTKVIFKGSLAEIWRVTLLSIAQHRHAAAIKVGPDKLRHSGLPVHERKSPPPIMEIIPSAIRLSKCSRKTNQAKAAVIAKELIK